MISCCLRLMIWQSIMVHSQCCMWISSVMWTVLVSHCPERTTKHLLILQKHNLNKKPCFEYYFESMSFLYFTAIRHHHHHPIPSFDPVYGKPNQTVGIKGEAGRPFTLIKWIGRPRQCLYCAPNHQCQGQGDISILNWKECFLTFGANWACACSYSVLS